MGIEAYSRRRIIRGPLSVALVGVLGLTACSEEAPRNASPSERAAPASDAVPSSNGSGGTASNDAASPDASSATGTEAKAEREGGATDERIASGRSVYNSNCIACHAMNPTLDGALGPAVAGASEELLEARIMRAEYPEGYAPKRPSRVMVPLPHLESKIPDLAAYLGSLE